MKTYTESYRYRVVNGMGVYGPKYSQLSHAKLRDSAGVSGCAPQAEVERSVELDEGAHRYWRWRRGKWRFVDASDPAEKDLAHVG